MDRYFLTLKGKEGDLSPSDFFEIGINPQNGLLLTIQSLLDNLFSLTNLLEQEKQIPIGNSEPVFLDRSTPDCLGNSKVIWKGSKHRPFNFQHWLSFCFDLIQEFSDLLAFLFDINSKELPLPPALYNEVGYNEVRYLRYVFQFWETKYHSVADEIQKVQNKLHSEEIDNVNNITIIKKLKREIVNLKHTISQLKQSKLKKQSKISQKKLISSESNEKNPQHAHERRAKDDFRDLFFQSFFKYLKGGK